MKKCFGISVSVCGGIVGAGFASGREVVAFFARFGFLSLLFCAVAGACFYFFSYIILITHLNKNCKINNKMFKNTVKTAFLADDNMIFTCILFLCELIICSAMFAAEGVLFKLLFESKVFIWTGLFLIFIFAFTIVSSERNLVHFVNAVLTCSLLFFISLILFAGISSFKFDLLKGYKFSCVSLVMPILYVGMNILTVVPLLKEESEVLHSKRDVILTSMLIGLIIFSILFVVCLIILLFGGANIKSEMILLEIIKERSLVLYGIYFFIIFLSVFTTLITTARGSIKCLVKCKNKYMSTFVVLIMAFLISNYGFLGIVDQVYPILGIVCVGYFLLLFLKNKSIKTAKMAKFK